MLRLTELKTDFGLFYIYSKDNKVIKATFDPEFPKTVGISIKNKDYFKALENYLEKKFNSMNSLTIDYTNELSNFSQRVYKVLINTKVGATLSYKEVARLSGNPLAWRRVGNVLKNNPIAILIPCHRVILSNGKLGGYKWGLVLKEKLLNFELTN